MARGIIVADASALIVLAKIGRLSLLREQYGTIVIGPALEAEVILQGRRRRAAGMAEVEHALAEGWLRLVPLTPIERRQASHLQKQPGLDVGEAEALSLAANRKLRVVIDDKEARHAAEAMGLSYLGTVGVLLDGRRAGHLTLDEFEDAIASLTAVLWLSPSVVVKALKIARGKQ